MDIFDNTIICKKCKKEMKRVMVERSGFEMRAMECHNCGQRSYHPADLEEYNKFNELKNKNFKVKLRQVGNSYAVSIPKEFIDFFSDFERMEKEMNQMVRLALEDFNRLSLSFSDEDEDLDDNGVDEKHFEIEKNGVKTSVHEKSQVKHINTKNAKGFISKKFKVVRMKKKSEADSNRIEIEHEPIMEEEEE